MVNGVNEAQSLLITALEVITMMITYPAFYPEPSLRFKNLKNLLGIIFFI